MTNLASTSRFILIRTYPRLSMEQKHVSEALKEKKLAEGALKTSFFGNWKADNDTAAHHYEKAGQFFKLGKSWSESRTCYIEAATYYDRARVLFSAGKCHEAAGICSKELGRFDEAHQHIERAGDYYTQNGTASTAITCYVKGAEALALKLPEQAAALYLRAGELEKDNDHTREAIKCYSGAKKIFARTKMYKECISAVQYTRELYEQLESYEHIKKCNMSLVILHLARGDSVAAKQSISGDVSLVADQLIDAVENGDDETINKLKSHGDIVYLDTEIAKIAKFLTQDGAVNVPSSQRSKPSNTTTTSSIFQSAGKKSNSQKEELFARPNRTNRDELFARTKPSGDSEKSELFSRPAPVTQPAAPVYQSAPQSVASNLGDDSNPFGEDGANPSGDNRGEAPDQTADSNPFGETDNNNPFEEDEEDLC